MFLFKKRSYFGVRKNRAKFEENFQIKISLLLAKKNGNKIMYKSTSLGRSSLNKNMPSLPPTYMRRVPLGY